MSWSFEIHGKDKEKLKSAATWQLNDSVKYMGPFGQEAMEPVIKLVCAAIDTAVLPATADYFRVKSNGHAEYTTHPPEKKGPSQCYFGIEVIPVYLPKTVD